VALEDKRLSGFDRHFGCPPNFFETPPLPHRAALNHFAKGRAFSINQVRGIFFLYLNEAGFEFGRLLEGIDDSTW
jgi:hypothetical protein